MSLPLGAVGQLRKMLSRSTDPAPLLVNVSVRSLPLICSGPATTSPGCTRTIWTMVLTRATTYSTFSWALTRALLVTVESHGSGVDSLTPTLGGELCTDGTRTLPKPDAPKAFLLTTTS